LHTGHERICKMELDHRESKKYQIYIPVVAVQGPFAAPVDRCHYLNGSQEYHMNVRYLHLQARPHSLNYPEEQPRVE